MVSAEYTDPDSPEQTPSSAGQRIFLFFLLVAVVAIGAYALGLRRYNAEIERQLTALERQQTAADLQRQNAIEQRAAAERERLIAERRRQNAVEQRALAERERLNAEHQRRLAIEQRAAAERERLNAENRRQEALQQRALAERERLNAEHQRRLAIEQRTAAERLRLLALARSLSVEALKIQQKDGDGERAALLAVQAYLFNVRNGGSAQNPDIYSALRQSVFALEKEAQRVPVRHDDDVRGIAFDVARSALFSAGDDGTVRYKQLAGDRSEQIWAQGTGRMQALAISGDGQRLAVGDSQGKLWLWSMEGQEPALQKVNSTEAITALEFSNGGNVLAGGHLDGSMSLWSLPSLDTPLAVPAKRVPNARVQPVAFPGFALVWAGESGLCQWEVGADTPPDLLGEEFGAFTAIAASSAAGGLLAAGTETGDIVLWNLERPAAPIALIGHASRVTSLAFSPDDGQLASGSLDNAVKIWNARSPKDEPISINHGAWVWDVAFSPSGEQLASAGADRAVRLWPTRADRMAEQLCAGLSRELGDDEWQRYIGADISYEKTCAALTAAKDNPTLRFAHETK